MNDKELFLWWFRWGLVATGILLLPGLFLAAAGYSSYRWIQLEISARPAPRVEAPVSPGIAGLPRRLMLLIQDPLPQAGAPRPEVAYLRQRREQHSTRRFITFFLICYGISGLLCPAGLIGWGAVGLHTYRRREQRNY